MSLFSCFGLRHAFGKGEEWGAVHDRAPSLCSLRWKEVEKTPLGEYLLEGVAIACCWIRGLGKKG